MSGDDKAEAARGAGAAAARRDGLGQLCFWLHFAVMIYILLGWAVPFRPAIAFYLAFLPAVAVQWWFNKNSCVLNNIESKLRTGSWRHVSNAEEGAWLKTLIHDWLGIGLTAVQVELLTYSVLGVLWALGLWRLMA